MKTRIEEGGNATNARIKDECLRMYKIHSYFIRAFVATLRISFVHSWQLFVFHSCIRGNSSHSFMHSWQPFAFHSCIRGNSSHSFVHSWQSFAFIRAFVAIKNLLNS
ncbi:MAG: hypothetical protein WAT16_08520 [Saprospiraceae bacterium]